MCNSVATAVIIFISEDNSCTVISIYSPFRGERMQPQVTCKEKGDEGVSWNYSKFIKTCYETVSAPF